MSDFGAEALRPLGTSRACYGAFHWDCRGVALSGRVTRICGCNCHSLAAAPGAQEQP